MNKQFKQIWVTNSENQKPIIHKKEQFIHRPQSRGFLLSIFGMSKI